MTTPIEGCPQPETPIRERAWTDEQKAAMQPTHWMDDLGRVCTAEFMRSDKAHGDYQLAYHIPCIKKGRRFVKLQGATP